ncbi:MAG: hypothetical protein R3Y46_05025 [Opitutales bacterium]
MSENNKDKNVVDLSGLIGVELSTAWSPAETSSNKASYNNSSSRPRYNKNGDSFQKKNFKPREFKKDRDSGERTFKPKFQKTEGGEFKKNKFNKGRKPFDPNKKKFIFKPTMEVNFYPEDAPFDKLVDLMKHLKMTYQLFEIAEIILEKPERFVAVAKNLPKEDGTVAPIYCATSENIPFETEAEARKYAIDAKIAELFEKVEIEVEAPKGNFQTVNKCSLNGDLLGAPNWHKYNTFLKNYHSQKFAKMPFEKFLASIESTRDADEIKAWADSMTKQEVYKLKEGEETFESYEAAANYVSGKFAEELVFTYDHVRLSGVNIEKLPRGRIRENIEKARQKQIKFSLDTANNLRGRLRRTNFVIYKRGNKGFAFVSAVKRKFLYEGDRLSEQPQAIYEYLLANTGLSSKNFVYKYLSIEKGTEVDEETKAKMELIASELRWLVTEGYVVEYSNSVLQANPYLPKPKQKANTKLAEAGSEEITVEDEPVAFDAKVEEEVAEVAVAETEPVAVEVEPVILETEIVSEEETPIAEKENTESTEEAQA